MEQEIDGVEEDARLFIPYDSRFLLVAVVGYALLNKEAQGVRLVISSR